MLARIRANHLCLDQLYMARGANGTTFVSVSLSIAGGLLTWTSIGPRKAGEESGGAARSDRASRRGRFGTAIQGVGPAPGNLHCGRCRRSHGRVSLEQPHERSLLRRRGSNKLAVRLRWRCLCSLAPGSRKGARNRLARVILERRVKFPKQGWIGSPLRRVSSALDLMRPLNRAIWCVPLDDRGIERTWLSARTSRRGARTRRTA